MADRMLVVRIGNPVLPDAPPNPGAGIGLRNVRERLHSAYGAQAVLDIERADGCFTAVLHVPLHFSLHTVAGEAA